MKDKIILLILIIITGITSCLGLYNVIYKGQRMKTIYKLEANTEDMEVSNLYLFVSKDYKTQMLVGADTKIKNEEILNNTMISKLYYCYGYDEVCIKISHMEGTQPILLSNHQHLIQIKLRSFKMKSYEPLLKQEKDPITNEYNDYTKLNTAYIKGVFEYFDGSIKEIKVGLENTVVIDQTDFQI